GSERQRATRARPLAAGVLAALSIVALAALVAASRSQCRTWKDSVSLWGNVVAQTRPADQAADHLAEAIRLAPKFPIPHNKLGLLLLSQGKAVEAEAKFAEAVRL